MDVRAVLDDVARLGPFSAVSTDPAEAADPTWRPVRDLHADPAPLRAHLARVARVLRADARPAASIAFQGLAARLVAPLVGAVVAHGVLPALTPDALHWRPAASGPWPLWCPDPDGVPVPDDAGGAAALAAALAALVDPLAAAVRAQVAVSPVVLHGDAASGVVAAARAVAEQRPERAAAADALVERLLAAGWLAGTGELLPGGVPRAFRRRSCCLHHRVPGGGLCGDCVLLAPRVSRAARR